MGLFLESDGRAVCGRDKELFSPVQRTKSKIRYLPESVIRPEIVSSRHALRWDPVIALPGELESDESTQLRQAGFSLSSHGHFHIQWVATQDSPPIDLAALSKNTEAQDITLQNVTPASVARVDFSTVTKRVVLELDGMPSAERLRVFGDLAALLRSHPSSVADALSLLRLARRDCARCAIQAFSNDNRRSLPPEPLKPKRH